MTRVHLLLVPLVLALVAALVLDQALAAGVTGIFAGLVAGRMLPPRGPRRRARADRPAQPARGRRPRWERTPDVHPGMTLEEWREAYRAQADALRPPRRPA